MSVGVWVSGRGGLSASRWLAEEGELFDAVGSGTREEGEKLGGTAASV